MISSYEFTPRGLKEFKKLPRNVQKQLLGELDYFVASEFPLSFAQRLINSEIGEYRFRVGDYRIIFDLEEETIVILSAGHRKEIYK